MQFELSEEQELLRRSIREFAETRGAAPRHGVGQRAALSDGAAAQAGRARPDGHPVPGGVRRRRHERRRLLHLHRGAGPRRSEHLALGRGPQWPGRGAHRDVCERGAEAALPRAAGHRAPACRLGPHRARVGQRRRRDAHVRGSRRRPLGPQRQQGLHYAWPLRRHDGRHGRHRPRPAAARASRPSSSSAAPRGCWRGRRKTSWGCARARPPR